MHACMQLCYKFSSIPQNMCILISVYFFYTLKDFELSRRQQMSGQFEKGWPLLAQSAGAEIKIGLYSKTSHMPENNCNCV